MKQFAILVIISVLVLGVAVQQGYAESPLTDVGAGIGELVEILKSLGKAFLNLVKELPKLTEAVLKLAESAGDLAKIIKLLGDISEKADNAINGNITGVLPNLGIWRTIVYAEKIYCYNKKMYSVFSIYEQYKKITLF